MLGMRASQLHWCGQYLEASEVERPALNMENMALCIKNLRRQKQDSLLFHRYSHIHITGDGSNNHVIVQSSILAPN